MELTKRKKSTYNIVFGLLGQMVTLVLGIVIPRLFLTSFGSEMNGFLNSITQIFAYFALLESGVGAASLQALYGPVGKDDKRSISKILAATGNYYKKTGIFYYIAVFSLAIIYPLAIDSTISPLTMSVIILINGLPGAISYFFQGKYLILLQAEGKSYINTALTSIISTSISVAKIIMLLLGFDIIAIQAVYLLLNLVKVAYFWIYLKKHYGWIDLKLKPNFKAISQKNSAFIIQICDLIFRNTDTFILSLFVNLKVVSIYAIYNLLISTMSTFLDHISHGFSFALGQFFNTNKKRYLQLRDAYETYRIALVFALSSTADIFILPFLKLYTSGVNDINYINFWLPKLFIGVFLLSALRANCAADINYAQHFKLTQTRCIIEAVINIVVSIICVNFWGIYGVLIGTIAALLYRSNDMIIYANKRILNRSPWITYKKALTNGLLFIVISYISSFFKLNLDSYVSILIWAAISGIIILAIYFVVASLIDKTSFLVLKDYIKGFLKSKKQVKNN